MNLNAMSNKVKRWCLAAAIVTVICSAVLYSLPNDIGRRLDHPYIQQFYRSFNNINNLIKAKEAEKFRLYYSNGTAGQQQWQNDNKDDDDSNNYSFPPPLNSSKWEGGRQTEDPQELINWVNFLNERHQVINEARYGKLGPADFDGDNGVVRAVNVVIVVQVHDRTEYVASLIDSLARVRGIERALLIFSHDLISEPLNRLIRNITFARTIQILYPYNTQLFPNTFPSITAEGFLPVREHAGYTIRAADVQLRHHFWWKMNYVVDGIIKRYGLADSCYFLRLEDDNIVTADLIHVLQQIAKLQPTLCPECLMLRLGRDLEKIDFDRYFESMAELTKSYWGSHVGAFFSVAMWDAIRGNCSKAFCTYDVAGWDHAFGLMSVACLPQRLRMLHTKKSPRVIAVHGCGVHHGSKRQGYRDYKAISAEVKVFLNNKERRSSFFPTKFRLTEVWPGSNRVNIPLHGWDDPLDHELCLSNTHPLEPLTNSVVSLASPASEYQQATARIHAETIHRLFHTKFKLAKASTTEYENKQS